MDSLNSMRYSNGSYCSCLSTGSDGEKRAALTTANARQFCICDSLDLGQ